MPEHTNQYGTAFGGAIMSWIDMIAAMSAQKYCNKEVVTVSIDTIVFSAPAFTGEHIVLKSTVNYVGKTSMEVGVKVTTENPITGESKQTTKAYLTFVALGNDKKPTEIPKLLLETEEEKRRFENAKHRVAARKELIKKLK